SPLNLNATNTFQGILGNSDCTPPGLAQALNYLPNQQRFNPAPNAPSAFVGQQYLAAGIPLILQPFGFPTGSKFQYAYANQANLTIERDLGHDFALSLQYNFNGGRRLNRSEEHTSELQSPYDLVCRLLLEKKKKYIKRHV